MAAACGVLLGERWALPLPIALAAISLAAAWLWWRPHPFPALVLPLCAFALVHQWNTREHPGRLWAQRHFAKAQFVRAEGVVVTEPRENARGSQFVMRLDRVQTANGELWPSHMDWTVVTHQRDVCFGDQIRAAGTAGPIPAARNPGAFDASAWLARRGIFSQLRSHRIERVEKDRGDPVFAFALRLRNWCEHTLGKGIADDPSVLGLIKGVTLGVTEDAESLTDAFRETGTYHLFSVSGLHVGMVALVLSAVLQSLGRRPAAIVSIAGVFLYTLVTGWQPASVRAAVMTSLLLAGRCIDRTGQAVNGLAAAFLLLLGSDTNLLFNLGFQMSFLVAGAILLGSSTVESVLLKIGRPDPFLPRKLWSVPLAAFEGMRVRFISAVAVSTVAWVASIPHALGVFHLLPLTSIPANLVAVPLSFAMLCLSLTSLLFGTVAPAIAEIYNHANWALARMLIFSIAAIARLPFSSIPAALPEAPQLTILDVGSGSCAVLQVPSGTWVIQCGSAGTTERVLRPMLHARGIRRVKGLILTDSRAAASGEPTAFLERFTPDEIAIPWSLQDRFVTLSESNSVAIRPLAPGSAIVSDNLYRAEFVEGSAGWTVEVSGPGTRLRVGKETLVESRVDPLETVRIFRSSPKGDASDQGMRGIDIRESGAVRVTFSDEGPLIEPFLHQGKP